MPLPVEHRYWHPVALASSLSDAPLAVTLMDRPLVLWRDGCGAVMA